MSCTFTSSSIVKFFALSIILAHSFSVFAEEWLVVGNAQSQSLNVFVLGEEGLQATQTLDIETSASAGISTPITTSPDKSMVYVALRGQQRQIISFERDLASKTLSQKQVFEVDYSFAYIEIDKTGQWLVAASYPQNALVLYALNASGTITGEKQVIKNISKAHAVAFSENNKLVFTTALGSNSVHVFEFDDVNGELKEDESARIELERNSGPRHLLVHNNKLYFNGEADGYLYHADINSASPYLSNLKGFQSKLFRNLLNLKTSDIHFALDNQVLLLAERLSNTLSIFAIADDEFELVDSIRTEKTPRGFAVSASGDWIFVAGQDSNQMSVYRANKETKRLKLIETQALGASPNWIEVITTD